MGDTVLIENPTPLVNGGKLEGEMTSLQALEEKARKAQEAFEKEEKLRKELEEMNGKLLSEKNSLQRMLEGEKGSLSEYQEKSLKLAAQKADIESQLSVRITFASIFFFIKRFFQRHSLVVKPIINRTIITHKLIINYY